MAGREGAGFVKDEGIDFRGGFDVGHILDENAQPRGGGQRGDHGGGGRQNKGAGAGHYEYSDDPVQIVGKSPDQRADHEDERRIETHVLIHDFLDR